MKKVMALLGIVTSIVFTGCATPQYACGVPGGVGCKSVEEVYELSNSGQLKITKALPTEDEESADSAGSDAKARKVSLPIPEPIAKPEAVSGKNHVGLRSMERKLRIWIAPWEDAEKDFHDEQYVYTIVEEGKWLRKENEEAKEGPMSFENSPQRRGFLSN